MTTETRLDKISHFVEKTAPLHRKRPPFSPTNRAKPWYTRVKLDKRLKCRMSLPTVRRRMEIESAARIVPYLTPDDVEKLCTAVASNRHGDRDALLIRFLYQTGLRISEALRFTLADLQTLDGAPVLPVLGKGKKPRLVSCPVRLAEQLQAHAYREAIGRNEPVFDITRKRAWQIIKSAGERASLGKPVWCHLLRHSDAIERLRQTGNPKALQIHLGHASPLMTMRYLATLTAEDAVRIQSTVRF